MRKRKKEIWKFYSENLIETPLLLPKLDERKGMFILFIFSVLDYLIILIVMNLSGKLVMILVLHWVFITMRYLHSQHTKIFFLEESSESLYPNSMDWGKRCVSLSLSAAVSDKDCERIVDCVKSFYK